MAKFVNNAVFDAALNRVALGSILTLCSEEPTTRTQAIATYKLADVALTPGDGNGDYTIGDGTAGNGRRLTIAEQAGFPVDTTGTATHIAICDDTTLLLVTTCTSQSVTSGNTVTVASFYQEVADPS